MNTEHKFYIVAGGVAYQVRKLAGQQEVLLDGKWIGRTEFVDELCRLQKWDAVRDLARAAFVTPSLSDKL